MADSSTDTLAALADEYWEALLVAEPLAGTLFGDHRYDDRVSDLSVEGEATQRAVWAGLRERAEALAGTESGIDERVTRLSLIAELDGLLDGIDHRLVELAYDQMNGLHSGLLQVASQIQAPDPDSAAKLAERSRRTGAWLDQGIERFRAGLAAGRTAPRLVLERSLDQLDRYLASPLDGDPLASFAAPPDWDGEPAWRAELTDATRDVIRPALARLRDVLRDELLPAARPDERCGLGWLDDGPDLYSTLIRHHTSLALDADEIHAIGLAEVTERLPAEFADVGGRLFGTKDLDEIFDRLRTDPSLRYTDADEIMEAARVCLGRAREAIPAWFGRLPQADCDISPVPDFLAPSSPAAYYFPPAGDGTRPGTYFVNTYAPESRLRSDTASVAFHEAIPGHHLQLAISVELDDLPTFRKYSWSHTAYVEGWALYTERLADEMGLYESDLERIGMLAADAWRACRLVVDTGLHALGWSRQQAIDFMGAHAPIGGDEVAVEVDRYVAMPGQALAYKMGQREIMRLRRSAEEALGDGFDIRGFHDAVLSCAAVDLPVLAEVVDDWVARAAS